MVLKDEASPKKTYVIESFYFPEFIKDDVNKPTPVVRDYILKEFSQHQAAQKEKIIPLLKKEKELAREYSFNIDTVVEHHRGIKEQQHQDDEARIKQAIDLRLQDLAKDVEEKAKKKGEDTAYEESKKYLFEKMDVYLKDFITEIQDVEQYKKKILFDQKRDLYQLVRSLVKWVILKELQQDGDYILRLLEKLILSIETTENLLIKVGPNLIPEMPEILRRTQEKLGELKNVRVEVAPDMGERPGIVLESIRGIIDASFESQMESLDKIFSTVEIYE